MRILEVFALGALALALSTVGCAADPADAASNTDDLSVIAPERVATDADADKVVQVVEGQDFVLKLGANGTTGYQWKVTKTNRSFAYPYASTYETLQGVHAIGSGGTQVFKWHTDPVSDASGTPAISKIGKHELTIEYRRPWEPATSAPAKAFKITVEVIAPSTPNVPKNDGTCGDDVCGDGQSCQFCWGQLACVPHGALC